MLTFFLGMLVGTTIGVLIMAFICGASQQNIEYDAYMEEFGSLYAKKEKTDE